jgi:hypothetical protein
MAQIVVRIWFNAPKVRDSKFTNQKSSNNANCGQRTTDNSQQRTSREGKRCLAEHDIRWKYPKMEQQNDLCPIAQIKHVIMLLGMSVVHPSQRKHDDSFHRIEPMERFWKCTKPVCRYKEIQRASRKRYCSVKFPRIVIFLCLKISWLCVLQS